LDDIFGVDCTLAGILEDIVCRLAQLIWDILEALIPN